MCVSIKLKTFVLFLVRQTNIKKIWFQVWQKYVFLLAAIGSIKYRIEVESSLCANKAQCVLNNLKKMMSLRAKQKIYFLHITVFMMLLTITMTKYSLPIMDFATRYSTRYSDFLLQPYLNPTRSLNSLLAGAWSPQILFYDSSACS